MSVRFGFVGWHIAGGVGGSARPRTGNQAVMSRRLCQLSYRPICNISSIFLSIDLPRQ